MDPSAILSAFGISLSPGHLPERIMVPFPAYRFTNEGGEWMLKRTRAPLAAAGAVARWSASLTAADVPVIAPAEGFGLNPRAFYAPGQEQCWGIYPLLRGEPYTASVEQIRAAGEMLGRMHAAGERVDYGLDVFESIPSANPDALSSSAAVIEELVATYFPSRAAEAASLLAENMQRYRFFVLPVMGQNRSLPLTNASLAFRASNLVFRDEITPVLIQPDSAARISRLFDLALVVLLFHNEGTGTARLFTRPEWHVFLNGYFRHVTLTGYEFQYWDDVLFSAWVSEALWLLVNHPESWANPVESIFMMSLLFADLAAFSLS